MVAGGHHLLVLPTVPTLLAIAVLHKEEIAAPVRVEEEERVEGVAPFLLCISEMELGTLKQELAVTDGPKLGFTTKTFWITLNRISSYGLLSSESSPMMS